MKKLKFFFFLLSALLVSGNVWSYTEKELKTPLTFVAKDNNCTITLYQYYDDSGGTGAPARKIANRAQANISILQYSYNGTSWSKVNNNGSFTITTVGDTLRICTNQNRTTFSTDSWSSYYYFTMTGSIAASGNIMSLVSTDFKNDKDIPCNYCFYRLFQDCSTLISAPALPATTLKESCYYAMFTGCKSLTNVPELPATTLPNSCYKEMFYQCTSLEINTDRRGGEKVWTFPNIVSFGNYWGAYMFVGTKGNAFNSSYTPESNKTYYIASDIQPVAFSGLYFKAITAQSTVQLTLQSGSLTGVTLQTSADGGTTWNDYTIGNTITLANAGDSICFSAKTDDEGLNTDANNKYRFKMTGSISASGNIMSLLYSSCPTNAPATPYCFYNLFKGCTSLTTAADLRLPAPTLSANCYEGMFSGCTSLTTAPELPALSLQQECYKNMFNGCTSLNYIKCLATNISANNCIQDWVSGVADSGTFVKSSNATCWTSYGSSAMPKDSDHPWTTSDYATSDANPLCFTAINGAATIKLYRFWTCDSFLSSNDVTLEYSYDKTNWSSYTIGTDISLKTNGSVYFRAGGSGNQWFSTYSTVLYRFAMTGKIAASGNITSLYDPTCASLTIPSSNCFFKHLFANCTSLISAPELPATSLQPYCYSGMFYNCTGLTSAPALPATILAHSCYGGCYNVYNSENYDGYQGMFQGCTGLTTAPELPATKLADCCYSSMFCGCTSLTMAPELPATTLALYCYGSMCDGCSNLTSAPELPATTLAEACYLSMFQNCTKLEEAPKLPATTLIYRCYEHMFDGCTSLTIAPELLATTLPVYGYYNMFNGCKKIDYIKCLATDISADYCLTNWLNGVAASGTFAYADGMASTWPTNSASGIPPGWNSGIMSTAVAWNNDGLLIETNASANTKVKLQLAKTSETILEDKQLSSYAVGNNGGLYNIITPTPVYNHAGENLIVTLYESSSTAPMRMNAARANADTETSLVVEIPANISTTATLTADATIDHSIWIGDGVTYTIGADLTVSGAVYVSPNGKLVVSAGKTLKCDSLILRAGMVTKVNNVDTYEYKYPQVIIDSTKDGDDMVYGSIQASKYRDSKDYAQSSTKDTIYYEYFLNSSQFYSFSLPYGVSDLTKVTYLDGTTASFGIQKYDEATRSTGQTGWQYIWSSKNGITAESTLTAGKGYVVYAFPQRKASDNKRLAYSYVRFPMEVNLSAGEKPVASNAVTKTGTSSEASGWNLIGQPYMSNFHGSIKIGNSEPKQKYVVIPANNGQSYQNLPIQKVVLTAFKNFFVQVSNEGILSFTRDDQASGATIISAPMREAEDQAQKEIMAGVKISCGSNVDDMGLLIHNNYTSAYEVNADLSKWMNTGLNLYASYGGNNLCVVATNESEASNSIPLVVKTDAAGTYTFARAPIWEDNVEELEHLYLFDNSNSTTTDLLTTTYSFTAGASTTIKNRFYLSAIRKTTPTDIESIRSSNGDLWVISGQGHLSVGGAVADGMVTIYSATGAMVYQGAAQANKPIALPQGMYVVKVAQDGATYTNNGIVY